VLTVNGMRPRNRRGDAIGKLVRPFGTGYRGDHPEFVAAEPCDGVHFPKAIAQSRCDVDQQEIANCISKRAVDPLEIVEIKS
jgi:hypothetical protein